MTSHLTPWKKEAATEFIAKWSTEGKGTSWKNNLQPAYVAKSLDTLIDRIHAHTLEEVRGKVEGMKKIERYTVSAMPVVSHENIAYNTALSDIRVALELLEHPTD